MPGSSPTIARREPTMRLKSVDLPTFGRPTIASVGTPAAGSSLIALDLIRVIGAVVGRWSLVVGQIKSEGSWPTTDDERPTTGFKQYYALLRVDCGNEMWGSIRRDYVRHVSRDKAP